MSTSTIRLTGIAAYATAGGSRKKSAEKPVTVFGAESLSRDPRTGVIVLEMGSVPLGKITEDEECAPSPPNGMFLLYGYRDRLNEIARRSSWAEDRGLKFVMREIEVAVKNVVLGITSKKNLATTEFAPLLRMEAALQNSIRDKVIEALRDDLTAAQFPEKRRQEIIHDALDLQRDELFGRHPNIVVRVIESDPLFDRLNVIVIPIDDAELRKEGKPSMRTVAYLRNSAKILGEVGGVAPNDPDELRLPDRLRPKRLSNRK